MRERECSGMKGNNKPKIPDVANKNKSESENEVTIGTRSGRTTKLPNHLKDFILDM